MKQITMIRKSVCTIANQLRGQGMAAAEAFRLAWSRVRETSFRVAGVTMDGSRQSALRTLSGIPADDVVFGLQREPENKYDSNAVRVLAKIKSLNVYGVLGYLPKALAARWAGLMDSGVTLKVKAQVIGGGQGFNYGLLVKMAV